MLDPNSIELKVMEFNEALQMVQGLEARGDFQFKGIHKMFLLVAEWTDKFAANHILPASEQIMREVVIDKARLDLFVHELCIKTKPTIIKKLSLLEFNPNGSGPSEFMDGYLRLLTVFARPGAKEMGSCLRYVDAINEQSVKAVIRYLKEVRKSIDSDQYKNSIMQSISENRLSETYASAHISNLFANSYDKDKEQKDITLKIHLKPLLKKLVEDKYLFFFRNENASKPVNKSVFLYNDKPSIMARIDAYKNFLKKKIVPDLQRIGVIGHINESDFNDTKKITSMVLPFMNDSYGDQKTVVEELILLTDFYEKGKQEEEKKKQKDKLEEVLGFLKESGRIVDLHNVRIKGEPLGDELLLQLKNSDKVRYTEFADKKDLYEYALHKENFTSAIDFARKMFKATKNDRDIQILRLMDVVEADPKIKESFEKLESESLFEYLPFLPWLWRVIFGNVNVHKFEADEIRAKLVSQQKELILKTKAKQIEKDKMKLAQERLKEKDTKSNSDAIGMSDPDSSMKQRKDENETGQMQKENEEKETIEKIVNILDNAWNQNKLPDREYLLAELGGSVQEENLIMFLKKHASKNIFSYQIRNQQEKYKWPILIARGYLKRNGDKLLAKAKKEVDKQKAEMMPDQEKFDVASSLEDFLVRILPKLAK